MKAVLTSTAAAARPLEVSRVADFCELVKVRLSGLVLLTTLCGFYMGSSGRFDGALMRNALAGTALLAFGAAALNQVQERTFDARMRRTANRPLPAGRMPVESALAFGLVSASAGLIWLGLTVNLLTCAIGALTLGIYNLIYTPLKRVTWLNTLVGAVPGALPPVMGWTAARNALSPECGALFAILFFWQIPHFLAIAWIYRDDYARAGFAMLPCVDRAGTLTRRLAVGHTAGLLAASLGPAALGLAGAGYQAGAVVLGLLFLATAVHFARRLSLEGGRRLFLVSILYLPLLLGLMVWDKIKL